jgi:LTXXQ motif family protein
VKVGGGGGARIGGGGFGGGRGIGISPRAGGGGGVAVRSFSAPRIGGSGFAVRSFGGGGNKLVGRSLSPSSQINAARFLNAGPGSPGNRFTTASAHTLAGPGHFARASNLARVHAALGHRVIANKAFIGHAQRSAFGLARFQGRFHGSHWPWWRGGLVIGWVGPVFWPYAYDDFFDYVFWPYAYDDFWPYAYDDVYYGIYGGFAYPGPAVGPGLGSPRPRTTGPTRGGGAAARPSGVCSDEASKLTNWPVERIAEVVQPTDAQRALLDALKAANAKAIDILKGACPKDLPSIPTGRLAAMQTRLEVMLQAVQSVRPALVELYQSLDDEQKARFNAIAPASDASAGKDKRDLATFCDERTPGVTDLPIDRIAAAVQPTAEQQAGLDELKDASLKAAEGLKADCPSYHALTPTGRIEAMEQRLTAMLAAVKTVQPALAKFYDSLSDEQKARFNAMRSTSKPVG